MRIAIGHGGRATTALVRGSAGARIAATDRGARSGPIGRGRAIAAPAGAIV